MKICPTHAAWWPFARSASAAYIPVRRSLPAKRTVPKCAHQSGAPAFHLGTAMQDIYIARAEGELALEEELWWALVSVYRQVVELLGGILAKLICWTCGDHFRQRVSRRGCLGRQTTGVACFC